MYYRFNLKMILFTVQLDLTDAIMYEMIEWSIVDVWNQWNYVCTVDLTNWL